MILALCTDDKDGMLFGGRRQSRDSVLCSRLTEIANGKKIFVSEYTSKLFEENSRLETVNDPLAAAGNGDICFAETADILPYKEKIEQLIIYKWNRSYPADAFLPFEPESEGLRLQSVFEFAGSSHEKITEEIYTR